ncbi:MAG: aspartate dehydrogenase [Alphaproteobacteria bacterium]|nr:aspartate dehydrogenase [Alphaproteobacteria bacterium]HCQ70709.1 aspartate dehydrogenase [Rhodospirillaceae bacterium]|tara:strand:- start:28561 stop:29358 length:798 start_codon:yes stop_codon:yes gene_type:complete
MFSSGSQQKKVGVIGVGAIGGAVCKALQGGIDGFTLHGVSDPALKQDFNVPNLTQDDLIAQCDLIVEALPPSAAQDLARKCLAARRDMIMISACALLTAPDILDQARVSESRIIVPSGALTGIDGVSSMKNLGIISASIASTKKPLAYAGAPYITDNNIDLDNITEKTQIFAGNALEAAKGFPANLNVAATLSLAGIGAENTGVEIWADPDIAGNCHEITVKGEFSTMTARVENTPDPQNPKSSMLAAQSIIATLRNASASLVVL